TEGRWCRRFRGERKIGELGGQKPADPRALQLEETADTSWFADVYFTLQRFSEQPQEQIEQMNSDVRHDPAGLLFGSFPGCFVPAAARRHVRETHVMLPRRRPHPQLLA